MVFAKGAQVKFLPGTMAEDNKVYTITQVIAGRDDTTGNVTVSVKLKGWRNTWHSIGLLYVGAPAR